MVRRILTSAHWGAFYAHVEDGRLVGVSPYERDPYPSRILESMPEMVYAPTRVRRPMVRAGWLEKGPGNGTGRGAEPFVPLDWDRALDLVAGELARVKAQHGNQAIFGGSYGWSSAGRYHHARTQTRRFLFSFGGCCDQVNNYSWGTAQVLLPHVVGGHEAVSGGVTDWTSIIEARGLVVALGGLNLKNGQVTSGGSGEHGMEKWMRQAAEAGVRFVVVSPLREDAPDFLQADWLPIRPNTDTALLLALAHTLYVEGLHDIAFLDRYTTGFERLLPYLLGETDGRPKDAAWAAAITGLDAEVIRALARRMAATRTMLTAAWSLQRADHGEQPYWAAVLVASMLGQVGLPGGGFGFGYGSINGHGNPRPALPAPDMKTGVNPITLAIPVARITDALLEPGKVISYNGRAVTLPEIRLIYWAGGNPFHHHQDLNRLLRGWQRPDTVVVHETHWTPTARHADIVLPATTSLERNDIGATSRDRFLIAMKQAIAPVGEARNDASIFGALAERLGCAAAYTEGLDEMGWVRRLYDEARAAALARNYAMPDFDSFWAEGLIELPQPIEPHVMFQAFRRDPEAKPLKTPSGRIELWSEAIAAMSHADCPPHPAWLEPAEWLGGALAARFPLHLLTSQPITRLHSQLDPGPVSRAGKVAGHEPVTINPADAAARGIGDGDVVRVWNDRGACLAGARLTDAIRPGVVVLPTGAWYDPVEPGRPGSLERHGNPNVLTLDKGTSGLAQGSSAMTALVEIERWKGEAMPIGVFAPPAVAAE